MKTILVFTLILGCIVATYSQFNDNPKTRSSTSALSFHPNQKFDHIGNSNFTGQLAGPSHDVVLDTLAKWTRKLQQNIQQENWHPVDNMPCLKPVGMFSMRVYQPDSTVKYTMLLKKD